MAGKVGVQDEFLDPVGSRIEQNILSKIPQLIIVALSKQQILLYRLISTPYSSLTLIRMTKDEKVLAVFKGLLL
jgi:hypothetical protein